jgi:hypothetical protein
MSQERAAHSTAAATRHVPARPRGGQARSRLDEPRWIAWLQARRSAQPLLEASCSSYERRSGRAAVEEASASWSARGSSARNSRPSHARAGSQEQRARPASIELLPAARTSSRSVLTTCDSSEVSLQWHCNGSGVLSNNLGLGARLARGGTARTGTRGRKLAPQVSGLSRKRVSGARCALRSATVALGGGARCRRWSSTMWTMHTCLPVSRA